MSTLREAAQQALEAMDKATRYMSDSDYMKLNQAIDDLKVALEQEEPNNDCHAQGICQRSGYGIGGITSAELSAALGWPGGISTPVLDKGELLRMVAQQEQEPSVCARCGGLVYDPVWVAQSDPPRREWRGLTDDEIDRITDAQWAQGNHKPIYVAHRAYARAIEAALKEKNNG